MIETCWDRKLGSEKCCGASMRGDHWCEMMSLARANEALVGLSPLDSPGTDAYFAAVMAAHRRDAAALGTPPVPASKAPKPRALKLSAGKVFSGQACLKCDRAILPGESLFAVPDWPAVVCAACQPHCEHDRSAVKVVALDEWSPPTGKWAYRSPPVLVPVLAV